MGRGRYYSPRDQRFIRSVNEELLNDIIQTGVILYRISPELTETNIYVEVSSKNKKAYYTGIQINAYIDKGELSTSPDDFIDKKQNTVFKFLYHELQTLNVYLQEGDLIGFNHRLYQCDNVVGQEQLLGGQPDKSFSIICNTHYSRFSVNDLKFIDQR